MTDMTKEGEKIHAYWVVLTALYVVMGKMTRAKAQKKALDVITEEYGEETLMKEFELEVNGNPVK